MKKQQEGFYFNPKKWLGDSKILLMDWDCRGMHLHFMAISWGNDPQGYILNDDLFLRKLISNLDIDDWNNRIKKKIFSQWKTKDLIIDNNTQSYYYHPGLIKLLEKEQKPIKTTTRSRKKPLDNSNDKNNDLYSNFMGFDLTSILEEKNTSTILHQNADVEDKHTIWKVGVSLITQYTKNEASARGFIAKQIKSYGEKAVAEAIAQLSIKSVPPAQIQSYLIGILNKQQDGKQPFQKKTGRGSVSL